MSPSQTIGPFFNYALTTNRELGQVAGPHVKGERIRLQLRLLDGDGTPVPDGMLELWQADSQGIYRHPDDPRQAAADPFFMGFGRLETNQNGVCLFETIRPGNVGAQSPHINVTVFARGLLRHLTTRVYFSDDPSDFVLALVPPDRRPTLIAQPDPVEPSQWNLDIHLQGTLETVFFDL